MKATSNEQALLRGLAGNDSAIIEQLYKENFSTIQAFILANNGSYDDARDVFQEAMIVLFEKAKDGQLEQNCQIKTYVYSVCRRLWLKRLQQLQRFGSPVESLEDVVPVEEE